MLGLTMVAPGYPIGKAFLLEFVMTFTLVWVVFGVAIDKVGFGKLVSQFLH